MAIKVIPDVVADQTIRALRPSHSALEAARKMREHSISAVVVLDDAGKLVGIVTERDLTYHVVAENRQASALSIAEVMTADPLVVAPDASPFDALECMRKHRVRHLPVVQDDRVVGMVSMRDLRQAIASVGGPRRKGRLGRLLRVVSGGNR